jgi:hypothetical protein
MWRIWYTLSTLAWHAEALWLKVAVKVWLNRATLRNGDRLVVDLQGRYQYEMRHGKRAPRE